MTDIFVLQSCLGNVPAANFCMAYLSYCHSIDDLLDRDNDEENTPDRVVKIQLEMFVTLCKNEFFLANKDGLLALMLSGFHSWIDSMDWQKSEDPIKVYDADCLKAGYHAVFYHVLLLVGGYDHARKISMSHRSFDHEPNTAKP